MKTFSTLAMIRAEKSLVFSTLRDELPRLASGIENIEEVVNTSSASAGPGLLEVINVWHAKVTLPGPLAGLATGDAFVWTDHASWDMNRSACSWKIEPRIMPERLRCSGSTSYEAALGGRGTRITFRGELEFNAVGLRGVPAPLAGAVAATFEAFLAALIPANFQKLARALDGYVNSATANPLAGGSAGAGGLMR